MMIGMMRAKRRVRESVEKAALQKGQRFREEGGGGGQEVTDDVGRAVIVTVKTATKPSIAGYFDVSTL